MDRRVYHRYITNLHLRRVLSRENGAQVEFLLVLGQTSVEELGARTRVSEDLGAAGVRPDELVNGGFLLNKAASNGFFVVRNQFEDL